MLKEISKINVEHEVKTLELTITPQYETVMLDEQEVLSLTNVYDIDETGVTIEGTFTAIEIPVPVGKIIFDDNLDWKYIGNDVLTEAEQNEIAVYIKGFQEAVPIREINYDDQFSFYLELETNLEYCTIKILGGKFEIWFKGKHMATLKKVGDSSWEQIDGDRLPVHSIREIGDRISLKQM